MAFLKKVGLALLAAFIVFMAMFGGVVFSIVSAIVSFVLAIFGTYILVLCLLCDSTQEDKDKH